MGKFRQNLAHEVEIEIWSSQQKQHFFSQFKQFQLKMRFEMLNVGLNFEIQNKNQNENGTGWFNYVSGVLAKVFFSPTWGKKLR